MSVVSGTDASSCTGTSGAPAICLGDSGADVSSSFGITWNGVSSSPAGGTNTDVYQPTLESGAKPIQKLIFQFNDSSNHSGDENAYTATTNQNKITINGGDNAIQMGNGDGTLKVNFNGKKGDTNAFVLDLSGTESNSNLNYSFIGNIETSYGTSKTYSKTRSFSAIFGKSVKGNITLNGGARAFGGDDGTPTALTFKNDANLGGNLTVGYDDAGVVFEGNGGITGNVVKNDGGKLLLSFNGTGGIGGTISSTAGVAEITYGSGNQKIQLNGDQRGVLKFIYGENVKDKIISVDNLTGSNSSSPTISSGDIVFDGVSQVIFNNGSSKTTGDGTLYIAPKDSNQNGSVKFLLDSSAGTSSSSPILKGSINANHGSVIFALKDVSGETGSNPFTDPNAVAPTKTYYVDGNITIDNGGLSAFWDDSIGFYGKIKATDSCKIEQTGGFIGKNDAWFEKGAIKSPISIIQVSSGTSHLVFEDAMTIEGVEQQSVKNAIRAEGRNNSLMVLFNQGATIKGDILSSNRGNNFIALNGTSATLGEDSSNKISISIDNQAGGRARYSHNAIILNTTSNTLNLSNLVVTGDHWTDGDVRPQKQTFNLLSFNDSATSNTVNIDLVSVNKFGNNIIGKNLATQTNSYDSNLFYITAGVPNPSSDPNVVTLKDDFATTFMSDAYTAQGDYTIGTSTGDAVNAGKGGNNYINVSKAIINGNVKANAEGANYIYTNNSDSSISKDVIADGGSNHITFKQGGSIKGAVTANTQSYKAGSNHITFKQEGSIKGAVTADGGNNSITFEQGGSIDGNILVSSGRNTIYLQETTNLNGDILSTGESDHSTNTIVAKNLKFIGDNRNITAGTTNEISKTTKNLITLQGETTFSNNMTIKALSFQSIRKKENIIKFDTGSSIASNTWNISELTASMNEGSAQNSGNPSNILDFGTISGANITIGSINKKDTISSNLTGYNYIGKNFTTGSGSSLALASNLNQNAEWAKNTHTANITLNVTGDIYSNRGSNYINVKKFTAKAVISEGGSNNIMVETTGNLTDAVTANRGNNTIIFEQGGSIGGAVTASGGNNNIDFKNAESTIGGNITANGGNNNITAQSLTIGKQNSGVTLSASGSNYRNENNPRGNTINVTNKLTAYFSSISASGTAHASDKDAFKNSVSGGSGSAINVSGNITATREIYGTNSNNLTADTIIVNGDIIVTGNGGKGINNLVINGRGSYISGNITTSDVNNGQNNFTLNADSADLTLKGKDTGSTNQEITALNATGGNNTLTLDNSAVTDGAMSTTIHSVGNGENLDVILNGKESGKGATLILDNSTGTTLKSVSLGTTGKANTISFKAGANTIQNAIASLENGKDLTIELSGANTSLNLAGLSKGSGTANIAVKTAKTNATLSGGAIDASALSFEDNTSLTLKNTSATFASLDASSASTSATLKLDGSNNAVNATINSLKGGNNLSVIFNGQGESKEANLAIKAGESNGEITLKSLSVADNSTHNTLDLSSLTKATITDPSRIGERANAGLTIKLKNTELSFTGGLVTDTKGTTTIRVEDATTGATLSADSGNTISITNLDMVGSGDSKVTFKSTTTIGTLTAQASGKNELVIGESGNTSLSIGTTNSSLASVTLAGDTAVLEINGGIQSIGTLNTNATTANHLAFSNNNITINSIANTNTKAINITLDNSSTLSLGGATNTIKKLEVKSGGGTIDLSSPITSTAKEARSKANDAQARKTLTIGESSDTSAFSGNLNFVTYANTKTADQIIVDGTGSNGEITIFAKGDLDEILSITREDNIKVAEIKNSATKNGAPSSAGGTNNITVKGGESEIDGIVLDLVVQEDASNKGDYYIGKTASKGVDTSIQKVVSTALTVNYDLYLANFNSLNKRMGELRDNPYNQGVWARVFGGAMSNDFGAGSKTNYVTAQAGYDYSLTLSNARNYMGVAIAYGKSWTKSNEVTALSNAYVSNVDSNMVEVGIYNSFVMDSGWYNDTILKFDYIMSDFTLKAGSVSADNHTNNFAMVLSDEFGYRYKFGSEKSWYIDPQVEVAFGYFNQSDFNHALSSSGRTKLEASQDSILTLRTRAGMSLGKKFTTQKGFASVYVGAFYEYDYIEGGNATTLATGVSNTLNQVGSNGRTIVNVGSNIELTEGVRMYIDVEKSFGDKQRTFMQFNFGARYSFGEKTLSAQNKTNSAPLKIENQNSQEQSDQSNSKEENTQANSQEQNTSSKE